MNGSPSRDGVLNLSNATCTAAVLLAMIFLTAAVSLAQTVKTVDTFNGENGLYAPNSLTQGLDGELYGTCFDKGAASGFYSYPKRHP